jgi:site-specific DNA-methyltransferase (adenine-specific)
MYKLWQGDCIELMKDIPDKSVDMILCDLPYGTTACKWDKEIPAEKLWQHYNRIISNTGSILLFASGLFEPRVMLSNIKDYKYKWVWVKNNSTNFVHAKNRPMTKHESILVFSKAPMGHISQLGDKRMTYNPQGLIPCQKTIKQGNGRFGTVAGERKSHLKSEESFVRKLTNFPTDVITNIPDLPPNKKLHTNEKPVALLEYLVKTYTNEGNTVLDNCMGSGSTGVACVNTGRNFIGIELDNNYFEIAKQRIEEAIK